MIIGKAITVGGGKGIPCVLLVTTSPGATVVATLGSKRVVATANSSGVATLVLKEDGTWTVTADYLGVSTSVSIEVINQRSLSLMLRKYIFKANEGLLGYVYYRDDTDDVTVESSAIKILGDTLKSVGGEMDGGTTGSGDIISYTDVHNGLIIGTSLNGNTGVGIDLTQYNTLNVTLSGDGRVGLIPDDAPVTNLQGESHSLPNFVDNLTVTSTPDNVMRIDVSTLSGTYFIGAISGHSESAKLYIYNIWLE